MMKSVLLLFFLAAALSSIGQKYKATESHIRFFSDAPIEDIAATNEDAISIMDLETGNIVFSVPIKGFTFEKSLMQEHFNENYLESDKYPKCIFLGKLSTTDLKDGENMVSASGTLDLHGVKREVTFEGSLVKEDQNFKVTSVFTVLLKDYKIKIPRALFHNIAEEIEVTVNFTYGPN